MIAAGYWNVQTMFGCLELFTFRTFGHIVLADSQLDTHPEVLLAKVFIDEQHWEGCISFVFVRTMVITQK